MKTYYVSFGGSGDPRSATFVGLSPTFLIFNNSGTNVTAPGITSVIGATGYYQFLWGTTTPIAFLIDGATTSLLDAQRYVRGSIDPVDRMDEVGTTLVAIGTTNIALGTTNIALGTTAVALGITGVAIGTTGVAIGTTGVAIGTTGVAIGTTILAISTTLIAIGLTNAAIGTTLALLNAAIGSTASSFGTAVVNPVDLYGYMKRVIENLEGNSNFTKVSGAFQILSRGSSQVLANKTITNSVSMVVKT